MIFLETIRPLAPDCPTMVLTHGTMLSTAILQIHFRIKSLYSFARHEFSSFSLRSTQLLLFSEVQHNSVMWNAVVLLLFVVQEIVVVTARSMTLRNRTFRLLDELKGQPKKTRPNLTRSWKQNLHINSRDQFLKTTVETGQLWFDSHNWSVAVLFCYSNCLVL